MKIKFELETVRCVIKVYENRQRNHKIRREKRRLYEFMQIELIVHLTSFLSSQNAQFEGRRNSFEFIK